ncbi:hypothetical protein QPK87_28125 [Kamptonema cortianum]|nr:hypothetical protein [Geitlerinema splendidum]MDK3160396.1 hypothetical protein [Kamptonema cortianum]
MPLLCVPNWSVGRERGLVRHVVDLLEAAPVVVHYAEADIDHNRTVTAFSGEPDAVRTTLFDLARLILPSVDLTRHTGVHPRIGGMDVCPFIPIPSRDEDRDEVNEFVREFAGSFAEEFKVPVFLYELSHSEKSTGQLPALRKGGFGGLLDCDLDPDYGPSKVHQHLGASVIGQRDFLIALNVNFQGECVEVVERIASSIRHKRREGDPRFVGVRALGFRLTEQQLVQVSMNITRPESVDLDEVIGFVDEQAEMSGFEPGYVQLIGVIRDVDVERTVKIHFRPEQVVHTRTKSSWKEGWN